MNSTFDVFDTVKVQHRNKRVISSKDNKGYFISGYESNVLSLDTEFKKTFDIVILGYYNNNNSSYLGNNIYISSTKMVLIEKTDFRLNDALELSNRIINSGIDL